MGDCKLSLCLEQVDICTAANECVALMKIQAKGKGLELRFRATDDSPRTVFADPRRLRQVLLNLMTNAIKFTERGSVTVVVKWEKGAEKRLARIAIVDTGVGISKDDIPKLFREFEMLDAHRKMNPNG